MKNKIVIITHGTNMYVLIAPDKTYVEPLWKEFDDGRNMLYTDGVVQQFIQFLVNTKGFVRQEEAFDYVRFSFPHQSID